MGKIDYPYIAGWLRGGIKHALQMYGDTMDKSLKEYLEELLSDTQKMLDGEEI